MKAAKQGNLTIAIEEPEAHLHPEAIRKIRKVIESIAENNQVIITTHSPIMVNRDNINSNIIIAKNSATPSANIKTIREQLGVIISDNLLNADKVILVEGVSDKDSIEAILKNKSIKICNAIKNGELVIKPISGTKNIKSEISRLSDDLCKVVVLLDDDQAGRNAIEQVKNSHLLDEKYLFLTITNPNKESEFEDLLNVEVYKDYIENTFNISIPNNFVKDKNKWSHKIEQLLASNGKRLSDKDFTKIKIKISNIVKSQQSNVIRQDVKVIDSFVDFLENKFL